MSNVAIEFGQSFRRAVEATVGETHTARWVELDGRIAAVRRTLRAAAVFNRGGSQNTASALFEYAAIDQMSELRGWRNLDAMVVADYVEDGSRQAAVFTRLQRQLFGIVPFGTNRQLYLPDQYGQYDRQTRSVRLQMCADELVLEPGSTVTLFTRKPGPEPSVRYAGADMSLKRDFDAISEAVHFKG